MDITIDEVDSLNDKELRSALIKFGKNVGPVTSGTRDIMKGLLKKLLMPDTPHGNDSVLPSQEIVKPTPVLQSFVQEPDIYYGIFIPRHFVTEEGMKKVYTSKVECLSILKQFQGARFKSFSTYSEALSFTEYGPIIVSVPNDQEFNAKSLVSSPTVTSERPSPFHSLKDRDILKFRKSIEQGNYDFFTECVNNNPRYLVSSGDTPVVLQHGARYNALHIACRSNRPDFCGAVLSFVGDPKFFQRLYPDDALESSQNRSRFLLDLYLNMPDKGFNETPLHFACKEGFVDCVKVLLSYPECDRTPVNRYGQTPREVICSRCGDDVPRKRIVESIFDDSFYVPILRDTDNCLPPVVGSPFSPTLSAGSSSASGGTDHPSLSVESNSPISPSFKVRGYAGPMSPCKAESFYRRLRKCSVPSPGRSPQASLAAVRIDDSRKGVERVGRNLAIELNVDWVEFWDFLGDFANISSLGGLKKLDAHLKLKRQQVIESKNKEMMEETLILKEKHQDNEDTLNIQDLGDDRMDVTRSSLSSMGELCQNLEALRLDTSLSPNLTQEVGNGSSKALNSKHKFASGVSSTMSPRSYLNNNCDLSQSPSLLNASSSTELLRSTSDQYNFAVQSTKISAQRISSILCDVSQSISAHVGPDFEVARKLTGKIKIEISALRKILSRCSVVTGLPDALDFGFIHLYLAVTATELFAESVSPADLFMGRETVKLVSENVCSLEQNSSDDDEAYDLSENDSSLHLQCVVRRLLESLELAVRRNKAGEEDKKIVFDDLGECVCRWWSRESSPTKLAHSSVKDFRSHPVDISSLSATRREAQSPSSAQCSPEVEDQKQSATTKRRFSLVKSLLGRFIFGWSDRKERSESPPATIPSIEIPSQSPASKEKPLARSLIFDDEEGESDILGGSPSSSFVSAVSSLENDVRGASTSLDDCVKVFIAGKDPSKSDYDAFVALDGIDVDPQVFPSVAQWLKLMDTYNDFEKKRWRNSCSSII